MSEETAGEMYARLGTDGRAWATEMAARFNVPMEELLPWTCSMIMAGYDKHAAEVRQDQLSAGPDYPSGHQRSRI